MIDREGRKLVRENLRHLVCGRISNDEFDDVYYPCRDSEDVAVRELSHFGWCLYSDDWRVYLRGKYAVDDATWHRAARYILFLHTDFEYEWPQIRDEAPDRARGCLILPSVACGVTFLLMALVCFLTAGPGWGLSFLAAASIMWVIVWTIVQHSRQTIVRQRKEFEECGDIDVWPFISREQFETAHNVKT